MRTLIAAIVAIMFGGLALCGCNNGVEAPTLAESEVPIYFKVRSARITPAASKALSAVATRIKNKDAERVRIVGYAARSSQNNPLGLAERRANAIRDTLKQFGVGPGIIEIDAVSLTVEQSRPIKRPPMIEKRRGEITITFER